MFDDFNNIFVITKCFDITMKILFQSQHFVQCTAVSCRAGYLIKREFWMIYFTVQYSFRKTFKGSDRQCMVVELRLRYYWGKNWFQLRPNRRFYGAYLFRKVAIFKILIDCPFWKYDFENRFYLNYSKTTMTNLTTNSTEN